MAQIRAPLPSYRSFLVAVLAWAGIIFVAPAVFAEVFHSKESALALAFGEGCEVESRELFLDQQDRARAEELAGSEISSRLVKVYEGHRHGEALGWVYFETHRVRTLPETLMVVVGPEGSIQGVHLLAFHEPEAYLPHDRFLHQFQGQELDGELSLRTGLQGMAGSTFSARAVTAAVRRVMAVHQVAVLPLYASTSSKLQQDRVD